MLLHRDKISKEFDQHKKVEMGDKENGNV